MALMGTKRGSEDPAPPRPPLQPPPSSLNVCESQIFLDVPFPHPFFDLHPLLATEYVCGVFIRAPRGAVKPRRGVFLLGILSPLPLGR